MLNLNKWIVKLIYRTYMISLILNKSFCFCERRSAFNQFRTKVYFHKLVVIVRKISQEIKAAIWTEMFLTYLPQALF